MSTERSLIEVAEHILLHHKKPMEIYDLFDQVVKDLDVTNDEKIEMVSKFYTDLTISAKFVYVGDNQWNLKANEKIELWEKDGSFYKEYNVVELPEEYKTEPYATKPKPKPAKVEEPVVEEVVEEVIVEPVVEDLVEEVVVAEKVKKPIVEPVFEEPATTLEFDDESDEEDFEEEVFDDYDDFDEDKYNEYMDTYEDKYDE
jgi:DNA-directed RNA polymerase subunit delta